MWHCTLTRFGHLSPVDWFAERAGRVVAVLEAKHRSHPLSQYPTVYLNVRKWLSLQLAAVGLGVPALFVVSFTDALTYTPVPGTGHVTIAGCRRRVKAVSDIEPVFEVPVSTLIVLDGVPTQGA